MANVTISLDEDLLAASREYAKRRKMSLNSLIRQMLQRQVLRQSSTWIDECFERMDQAGVSSDGRRWTRDELYDL